MSGWKAECLRWRDEAEAGNYDALVVRAEAAERKLAAVRAIPDRVTWHPQWGRDDWREWFRREIAAVLDSDAPEAPPTD